MMKLKELLENFKLSEVSRQEIINGNNNPPTEFEEIAKAALAGYFSVKTPDKEVKVRPTCVEFYYHEEIDDGIHDGIKDYIVYHRNSKYKTKGIFDLGILHNHVSGIDITFEKGEDPESAIRASMLIREFKIEGSAESEIYEFKDNEDRATKMYEALFQQSSIFDGFSVIWVDGDEDIDVETSVRKNVAEYEGEVKKSKADVSEIEKEKLTENLKYVQDQKKWAFRKKQ